MPLGSTVRLKELETSCWDGDVFNGRFLLSSMWSVRLKTPRSSVGAIRSAVKLF
jgi:hypothetical protein